MAPQMQLGTEMRVLGGEAEPQAHEVDIESLQPLSRGLSLARSWKIRGNRTGTGFSGTSIGSAVSHWSFVARWTPSRRSVAVPLAPASLSEAHSHFIAEILGGPPPEELKAACTWYTNFLLEFKIRESWATLFIPVLRDAVATAPGSEDLSLAFQILKIIVRELKRENLALIEIVDILYNEKLLRETDDERSQANQLVLAALGWITSLFSAAHNPEPMKLQIIPPWSTPPGIQKDGEKSPSSRRPFRPRRGVAKKTFTMFSQSLENNDQPLHSLLGRFGTIIPQRQQAWGSASGHLTPASLVPIRKHEDEKIEVSLLCYYTLNKVAKLKIEWVDSLSLHLEFDSHTKVLNLFRLPSLCLLMCCGEKASPLSQLFTDTTESHRSDLSLAPDDPEDLASDYHREVLLSYRLLFGQDLSSSSSFQTLIRANPLPLDYPDPLLPILCGANWQDSTGAKEVGDLIQAEDPSPQYSASTHFPFLGRRLLDIQKHVKVQKPRTWLGLWNDKRDPADWLTFWAVLFFGTISLVFMLIFGVVQTVLAAYQVYYAKQQFLQQPGLPT